MKWWNDEMKGDLPGQDLPARQWSWSGSHGRPPPRSPRCHPFHCRSGTSHGAKMGTNCQWMSNMSMNVNDNSSNVTVIQCDNTKCDTDVIQPNVQCHAVMLVNTPSSVARPGRDCRSKSSNGGFSTRFFSQRVFLSVGTKHALNQTLSVCNTSLLGGWNYVT